MRTISAKSGELTQQDMLVLQTLLEKKSQLEQMISNVMKALSETTNSLASALKAKRLARR